MNICDHMFSFKNFVFYINRTTASGKDESLGLIAYGLIKFDRKTVIKFSIL